MNIVVNFGYKLTIVLSIFLPRLCLFIDILYFLDGLKKYIYRGHRVKVIFYILSPAIKLSTRLPKLWQVTMQLLVLSNHTSTSHILNSVCEANFIIACIKFIFEELTVKIALFNFVCLEFLQKYDFYKFVNVHWIFQRTLSSG